VIQNQHQYKVTNSKLKDLQQSLVELANNPRGLSERLLQAEKVGLQIWIDRLKAELDEYNRYITPSRSISILPNNPC
jgi:hypothetical protein